MTRKIDIFDTTLRDGEQSPGASMNTEEKLVVAQELLRMHVDIIEGLRVASPASCWAMLGGELSERDLVRLGDAIVCIPRGPGGQLPL